MTDTQVNYMNAVTNRGALDETRRNNIVVSEETARANKARERETHEHNVESRAETHRSNVRNEDINIQRNAETGRHNVALESLTASQNAETERANRARELQQQNELAQTAADNAARREQDDINSRRDANVKLSSAKIQAAANRYGASTSAAASRYGADQSASASRYSADRSSEASKYSANQSAAASRYSTDTISMDKYKQRLTDTAQKGYDRASAKDIAQIKSDNDYLIAQLNNYQKTLDRNSREYIETKKLKQDLEKFNEELKQKAYDRATNIAQSIIKSLGGGGGLPAILKLIGG